MCTAIGLHFGNRFFGRNLDLEQHFGERIVLTPRGFSLPHRYEKETVTRFALLGMAAVRDGFPLYAEAINEKGLAMAGLNFVGNAAYFDEPDAKKTNITTFELIPWVLGQAETIGRAGELLNNLHLMSTAFEDQLPPGELHWFLTDGEESLVLECTKEGIRLYNDPLCVLTNNPPFRFQLAASLPFLGSRQQAVRGLLQELGISAESLGSTGNTIPGDYSSTARFARASWLVQSAKTLGAAEADLATCFQILSAVAPVHGSVTGVHQKEHYTLYTVCANLSRGEFYWRGSDSPNTVTVRFADFQQNADRLVIIDPT
ncbi:MAG: linear amide C-N hydrolase [Clostridia bacterium]|nr:linear amide C-N hydrolase [Clostridia bacterium]